MGGHIDSVFSSPGAHDDATGEGIWLEVARVMRSVPLDKEIRFGGFGGEEQGLTVPPRGATSTSTSAGYRQQPADGERGLHSAYAER